MEVNNGNREVLSKLAGSNEHGEKSAYFDGWKAYEADPFHPTKNPDGVIQMGLAENQLSIDLVEEWINNNPTASICTPFKDVAIFQDYHGLPQFTNAMAKFMGKVRGGKVSFDPQRIVMAGGATGANEMIMFCLADPGDAFLIPTPYYPGFDRDLRWRTRIELLPVVCQSSNNFQITKKGLEEAYENAQKAHIRVKGLIIANPSNPLGTTMDKTLLTTLVNFINDKQIHLVCDEVYAATIRSENFISISEIIQETEYCNPELIHVVYSLSKDMGFPGFRVGIVYSYNDKVVDTCRRMSSFGLVSSQTQYLLASMLSDEVFTSKFLLESKKRLKFRYERFSQGLKQVGIRCLESEAGLFCWMDLRPLLKDLTFHSEMEMWRVIINEVKLNVSPGSSFHCHEPGWFRACFANIDIETMAIALRRITRKFVAKGKDEKEIMVVKKNDNHLRLSMPSRVYDESMMLVSPKSSMVRART